LDIRSVGSRWRGEGRAREEIVQEASAREVRCEEDAQIGSASRATGRARIGATLSRYARARGHG
jgi:hypothetical protein